MTPAHNFESAAATGHDILNAKPRRRGWINVYLDDGHAGEFIDGKPRDTEEESRAAADPRRTLLSAIPIEWEE